MKQPVQLFPTKLGSYSDVYASREKTAYRVGRPDGSPMSCYNLSEREAKELLENLPEELLDHVKEHFGLVEGESGELVPETEATELIEEVKEETEALESLEDGKPLEEMTGDELRDLCKQLGLTGYSRMKNDEMVELLYKHAEESDDDD